MIRVLLLSTQNLSLLTKDVKRSLGASVVRCHGSMLRCSSNRRKVMSMEILQDPPPRPPRRRGVGPAVEPPLAYRTPLPREPFDVHRGAAVLLHVLPRGP